MQAAIEKGLVEDRDIARSIKQEFDRKHGPTWHCVVGKHFGKTITSPSAIYHISNDGSAIVQSTEEHGLRMWRHMACSRRTSINFLCVTLVSAQF